MPAADAAPDATPAARRPRMPRALTTETPRTVPPTGDDGMLHFRVAVYLDGTEGDGHGPGWWMLDHEVVNWHLRQLACAERKSLLGYDKRDTGAHSEGLVCDGPAIGAANILGALKAARRALLREGTGRDTMDERAREAKPGGG